MLFIYFIIVECQFKSLEEIPVFVLPLLRQRCIYLLCFISKGFKAFQWCKKGILELNVIYLFIYLFIYLYPEGNYHEYELRQIVCCCNRFRNNLLRICVALVETTLHISPLLHIQRLQSVSMV
jgi:hypothetical protein